MLRECLTLEFDQLLNLLKVKRNQKIQHIGNGDGLDNFLLGGLRDNPVGFHIRPALHTVLAEQEDGLLPAGFAEQFR